MVKLSQLPGQLEKQTANRQGQPCAGCAQIEQQHLDWGPRGVMSLAWEVKEGLKAEKVSRERRGQSSRRDGVGGVCVCVCTWQARADTGVGGV